jgi:FSR family fosmidomycin resistance protein-like MFS transporter
LALGAMGLLVAPILALTLLRLRYDSPTPTIQSAGPSLSGSPLPGEITSQTDVQPVTIVGVSLLMAVIFLRSWVSSCLTTYLPQYFIIQGFPLDFAGQVLFAYGLLAPLGSLAGGFLADRAGPRAVIAGSLIMAAPLIVLQLRAEGIFLMANSFVLGFVGTASLPLTVVLGQRLMPERPGVMSGLTMGFTFIMGGIGTYLTGVFADRVGLGAALAWLPLLLAVSGMLAVFLPGAGRPPRRSLNRQ